MDRSCLPTVESDLDILKQAHAEELAVQVLWALSGRQYGVCPVILRPCVGSACGWPRYPSPYDQPMGGDMFSPLWNGSVWMNVTCACLGSCTWDAPSVVHLPMTTAQPVQGVTEVRIGNTVLDPSAYTLEGDLLYRAGGLSWPTQDLTRPLPEDGTWSVTYLRGVPVPAGTGVLTGLLAKEFMAACSGGKCRLPRRVQSVSRQGVTYDMIDPLALLNVGKTGLPEVDLWLQAVNPNHLQAPPKVR